MVLVSGEPGIGKSRIAVALQVHRARLGRPHKITLKINGLYLKKRPGYWTIGGRHNSITAIQ
jgi:transcriptional regulator with AAA-type ATPase domain